MMGEMSRWLSGRTPDCGARGPRFESHRCRSCLSRQSLRYTALGTGCAPLLQCIGRLTTLRGTVKWVSAYELSNNNKWRWCLRMIAADRRTHSPNRLVWSEGWRPPSAQSAVIKWTGWTLAMTMSWWQHHKHCPGYYYYYYYCSQEASATNEVPWDFGVESKPPIWMS